MRLGIALGLNTAAVAASGGTPTPTPGLLQSVRVAFVGDSTTNGSNGGSGGTSNYLNSRPHAPAVRVATLLNADGINAMSENVCGVGGNNTISVWTQADGTRHVQAGNWSSLANLAVFGGHLFQSAAVGTSLQVKLFGVNRIKIYYPVSTFGDFTYSIDGGAPVTLSGTGTKALAVETVDVAPGDHTVDFVYVSGTTPLVHIIEGQNTTRNEVRCLHAGARGAKSADFVTNTSTNPWLFRNANSVVQPDLVVLNIGINDVNQNVSAATYESNVRAYLTNCRAINANVGFILEKPNAISLDGSGITQMQVRSLIDTLVTDYSAGGKVCIAHDRWASMGVAGADGPTAYNDAVSKSLMSDTLHPNTAGYDLIGTGLKTKLVEAMTAIGVYA